jgi:UDPglucose 6-dehydrogenase
VLGFAFKKDTNDTRESSAISICKALLDEQARLAIYDPKVEGSQIFADLEINPDDHRIEICSSVAEATNGAHAMLVLTEWNEFRDVDYAEIFQKMHKPAWVFDGRNILDMAKLRSIGFYVYSIGKPESI